MKNVAQQILLDLVVKYPSLKQSQLQIEQAFEAIQKCYEQGGTLLVCGNGGSASDSDHIVGELMKGFVDKRELPTDVKEKIIAAGGDDRLANSLQGCLAAINLSSQNALTTAIGNDIGFDQIYAQQVLGYGNSKSCLLGISTSGNSQNVLDAGIVAKAMGMKTIALTGDTCGRMKEIFDITIRVPKYETASIQELHLPIYHTICRMLEVENF